MYETIYIEKNKSSRFGVYFYQDSTQWNVFEEICGIAKENTAVICNNYIKNDAWKAFADSYANADVLRLKENEEATVLHDFLIEKKNYTFIILADSFVMNYLYENITAEEGKISFISVPVTPCALFDGITIRPQTDAQDLVLRKELFPKAAYVDVSLLSKATPLEFQDGIASAFRLCVSHKASMFEWMISNMYELTDNEEEAVCELLERGFNVWKERIEKDTAKERALTIYGEEFYNLLKLADKDLSEAELISLSVVCQTYLSWKKELISMDEYYEVRDMLVFFGLSITETFATAEKMLKIWKEKISINNKESTAYIRKVGKVILESVSSVELVKEALEQIYYDEQAVD